ncbi:MAG: hypothetical protein JJU28_05835 [Cyclobacteriaceae bacterium]|nr:hypothetical protein [Cyclobacteriaceae bacterium]
MHRHDQMALLAPEMLKTSIFEADFAKGLSRVIQDCLLQDSWDDEQTQVGAGTVAI